MEQPCYKCRQTISEGVPFCPHCGAAQIRVVIAEPALASGTLAEAIVSEDDSGTLRASQTVPVLAVPMRWSDAAKPCALAALVAAVLTSLGLNAFVAMLGVGFLSVALYRRPGIRIAPLAGARLGALGGLLWFAVSSIVGVLKIIALHQGPEIRDEMFKRLQQVAVNSNDPQVTAFLDYVKTPEGFVVIVICTFIALFLFSIVLGSLGGALGGAVLGRRDKA